MVRKPIHWWYPYGEMEYHRNEKRPRGMGFEEYFPLHQRSNKQNHVEHHTVLLCGEESLGQNIL